MSPFFPTDDLAISGNHTVLFKFVRLKILLFIALEFKRLRAVT